MKLSVVFPVHNQLVMSDAAIDVALENLSGENDVELIVIDNGSTPALQSAASEKVARAQIVRLENNIGVYPLFWEALKYAKGDIVAVFHSDVFIAEKGWDTRVIQAFSDQKLGLLGFIGSDEIDAAGGRGLGTSSNMLGGEYYSQQGDGRKVWTGSPSHVHGRTLTGYMNAAVVDGCAMIFRRSVLEAIPQRLNFPPHHFYDKLLSCEVRELGYYVGILGIGFDHISGQTVNQESSYQEMAKEWAEKNLGIHSLEEYMVNGAPAHNWDTVIYHEAEHRWLKEYRDTKHLIPVKV